MGIVTANISTIVNIVMRHADDSVTSVTCGDMSDVSSLCLSDVSPLPRDPPPLSHVTSQWSSSDPGSAVSVTFAVTSRVRESLSTNTSPPQHCQQSSHIIMVTQQHTHQSSKLKKLKSFLKSIRSKVHRKRYQPTPCKEKRRVQQFLPTVTKSPMHQSQFLYPYAYTYTSFRNTRFDTCPYAVSRKLPNSLPAKSHVFPTSLPVSSHVLPTSLPLVKHLLPTSLPVANHVLPTSLPLVNHVLPTSLPVVNHVLPSSFPVVNHVLPSSFPAPALKQHVIKPTQSSMFSESEYEEMTSDFCTLPRKKMKFRMKQRVFKKSLDAILLEAQKEIIEESSGDEKEDTYVHENIDNIYEELNLTRSFVDEIYEEIV